MAGKGGRRGGGGLKSVEFQGQQVGRGEVLALLSFQK